MRTFADLLDEDLKARGLMQDEILHVLVADDEPIVTSSAVSMWRRRNRVPAVRLKRLIDYFGPDSALAKAQSSGEFMNPEGVNKLILEKDRVADATNRARHRRAVRDFSDEVSAEPGEPPRFPDPRHDKTEYFTQRSTDVVLWLAELVMPLGLTVNADVYDRRGPADGEIYDKDGRRIALFELKDLTSGFTNASTWAHQLIGRAWWHQHVDENRTPILPLALTYDAAVADMRPMLRGRAVSLINVEYALRRASKEGLILPHVELKYDIKEGAGLLNMKQADDAYFALEGLTKR